MQFFYSNNIKNKFITLEGQEMIHCTTVLRKSINDFIYVVDGKGSLFYSKIIEIHSDYCKLLIDSKKTIKRKINIHLLISPTKNHKRIEWMIEKVVEIGVERITFLICQNSIRKTVNLSRLNKIALSAMKQTQNTFLPLIDQCISFEESFSLIKSKEKYIAHLNKKDNLFLGNAIKSNNNKAIFIGPEGDFDKNEVEYSLKQNCIEVSLGSSRLRTETSGIVSAAILNIDNE